MRGFAARIEHDFALSLAGRHVRIGQRQLIFAITLLLHVLLFVLLLRQVQTAPVKIERQPDTFELIPVPKPTPERKKPAAKAKQATKQKVQPPKKQEDEDKPSNPKPAFITLTRDEFAASDIANLPSRSTKSDSGGSSSAVAGPGEGPGGARLFNADWYRRPTNAELSTYLPPNAPRTGWGEVACKTIENYHVENCRQIGEFPLGSGFSRAVREAAWQFLVWPPRIDGRPMIGTWVRIRITYTESGPE